MKKYSMLLLIAGLMVQLISVFFPLTAEELYLLAGAGLRKPTDRVIQFFEKETDHKVLVEYGGAGKLLARYKASKNGDLFMPGSLFYIETLKRDGLVFPGYPIVQHTAVIAVHRNCPKKINSLPDLSKPGIRIALGDPKAMAFGRTSIEILNKSGLQHEIRKNTVVYGATVNQLTLYVLNRVVDASIIGRSNAYLHRDRLRMIHIPPEFFKPEIIAIALFKTSRKPELARQFQDFIRSEKGIEQFRRTGFIPLEK